jgi:hypothetical protein
MDIIALCLSKTPRKESDCMPADQAALDKANEQMNNACKYDPLKGNYFCDYIPDECWP